MDSKSEVGSTAVATSNTNSEEKEKTPFKMPIMIGKKSVLAKPLKQTSVKPNTAPSKEEVPNREVTTVSEISTNTLAPSKAGEEKPLAFPYEEPEWGGLPPESYSLEVLKEGVIVEKVDLSGKPFHVVGRSDTCDVPMQHLSVSRFHCIIQYCANEIPEMEKGMYLYDMGSTHGTFLHGHKVIPRKYQPLRVGHMFKVGGSKRMFILNGPRDDEEPESQLSITELKLLKMQKLEEKKKEEELAKTKEEMRLAEEKKQLEEGISWGMPEEAEEATDLAENPYAVNEELDLEDPKKTLRGWFEREGYELEYDVNEKAPGHYICRVTLPVDNNEGRQLVAEASHKGKKKEAVLQCALEACKILDNLGLLRQAKHESRAKREKYREEEDFYSSDEDSFLDRTGELEMKRRKRMLEAGKLEERAETFESLTEKHSEVLAEIDSIGKQLEAAAAHERERKKLEEECQDSLDAYMTSLKSAPVFDTSTVAKLKIKRIGLQKEELRLRKLVEKSKPALVKF